MEHDSTMIEDILKNFMAGAIWNDEDMVAEAAEQLRDLGAKEVCTYDEGFYLTTDKGVVLKTENGSDYQLTVVG